MIGGSLCTLAVKMNAWNELFPDRHTGGPMERVAFITTEMLQGIEKI